jgi:hypothetical protein
MPATEYWANLIAVAAKGGAAFQGPATIYLALVSDTPTKAVAGTPVVYTGYARPSYAQSDFDSDGIGNLVNGAVIVTFATPTGGDDWAYYVEAWTAASAGSRLWFEELADPIHLTADLPAVTFPLGTLHFGVV